MIFFLYWKPLCDDVAVLKHTPHQIGIANHKNMNLRSAILLTNADDYFVGIIIWNNEKEKLSFDFDIISSINCFECNIHI